MKKEYPGIDIGKFICAILVIIIHTKPFNSIFWLDAGLGIITRFAVPFFFVASSQFLFMKIKDDKNNAYELYKKYFVRLIIFYGIWYIIFNMVDFFTGKPADIYYYIKQFFFNTSGSPLWFLCALLWSSAIVFILTNIFSKKLVMAISVFCLAIGYCFSTLHPLFDNIRWINFIDDNIISFIGTQNGFFFGFPYVALGALVVEYDFRKNDMVNVIGIIGSLILLMGESLFAVRYIGTNLTFLWLSALPLTYFTLQLAMTVNIPGDSRMFFLLRKSSTLIYVLHVLIMAIVARLIISCGLEQVDSYHVIYFTATTVITTILAFLIVKLSTVSGFKFLRYFM